MDRRLGRVRSMDVGLLGLLAVFMCPMVFGGITFYYSHKTIHQETLDRWERQKKKGALGPFCLCDKYSFGNFTSVCFLPCFHYHG